MPQDDDRTQNTWLRYSTLGVQFTVTLLLFVLMGTWADGRFATTPWCTITGSLLGIFASMYVVIREVGRR